MNQGIFGFSSPLTLSSITPNVVSSTVTTSTVLTISSAGYQIVSMLSAGQSITLPFANLLDIGGPRYIFHNTGIYPFGIRDSSGTLLMSVAGGGIAYVTLESNSTSSGTWAVEGNNLEPGLITIANTFSSTFKSTAIGQTVSLDNNTSIHFAELAAGGFSAYVEDNTGKVLTTPVTVTSSASNLPVAVFKVSSTSALLFYGTAGTNAAVVLTLSGSSPSLSLSVGTPQTIAGSFAGGSWGYGNASNPPQNIVQLTSTLYFVSYVNTNNLAVAVSVSGATVTIGSPATVNSTNPVNTQTVSFALTSTTAAVCFKNGAAAPFANNVCVVSVSGTTCTPGTPASLTGCTSSSNTIVTACFVSPTKIVVIDDANTTNVVATSAAISGTTVTAGTAVNVETGLSTGLVTAISQSATQFNPHVWLISAGSPNLVGLWYLDSSGNSRVVVLSESAGTITPGTILNTSISNGANSGAAQFGAIGYQNTTDFIAIKQIGVSNSWNFIVIPHKISGTTITYGSSKQLSELSPLNSVLSIPTTRLSSGDYIAATSNSSAIPVLRSNGDAINKRGSISIPNMAAPSAYPIKTVSSNRIVLSGATQGTTVAAGANQQLMHLTIEIAQ